MAEFTTTILVSTLIALMSPSLEAGNNVEQIECLANNVYFEARGEDIVGKRAVAHVTLNRMMSKNYPDTICEVVWQTNRHRTTKRKVPQFSWTLDGRSDKVFLYRKNGTKHEANFQAYKDAMYEAYYAIIGVSLDPTKEATNYYAHEKVTPKWAKSELLQVTVIIGGHTFMKPVYVQAKAQ